MRRPAEGATGGWVILGLVSSGFLCVSSHYLILPRVSSVVVFLPGESQGWGILVGCHPWGRTELDTTEAT